MSRIMTDTGIDEIRAFNRFYTRLIGVLDEHIAQSPFSLAEARVLYEIGSRGHTTAAELSRLLDLDRAYLSRLLQGLLARELLVLSPIPSDRRQNSIALSSTGDKAVERLQHASEESVAALIGPLDADARLALRDAMGTIRRLLGDDLPPPTVVLRPHRIGELGWLIHRQALLYNRELGWNGEFEALIARIYHEFEQADADPPKALWVADRGGRVVGSVFVTAYAKRPGVAQLRMLYVEPEARGLGIGGQLVDQSIDFARRSGYAGMRLWTQSTLTSARRLYAAAGFHLVESGPHHSFGQDLVGEYWEIALQ